MMDHDKLSLILLLWPIILNFGFIHKICYLFVHTVLRGVLHMSVLLSPIGNETRPKILG